MAEHSGLQSTAAFVKTNPHTSSLLPKGDGAGAKSEHAISSGAPTTSVSPLDCPIVDGTEKTKLYLAYGSNLSKKSFQERRKVRPLRAINVVVPSLQLVFDLAGIPYTEPCFANSRMLDGATPDHLSQGEKESLLSSYATPNSAAGLGWTKGLVGVVYEVTESDYAKIIATEGGGSSYSDIEVECFPLDKDATVVPSDPSGETIIAHTLFAANSTSRRGRDDGWAEPSERYLGLISTGAAENGLPLEYQQWLKELKPFRITTTRQTAGKFVLIAMWAPPVLMMFGLSRLLADKRGRVPTWLGVFSQRLFAAVWTSYDLVFKRIFGEGERTIGDRLYP